MTFLPSVIHRSEQRLTRRSKVKVQDQRWCYELSYGPDCIDTWACKPRQPEWIVQTEWMLIYKENWSIGCLLFNCDCGMKYSLEGFQQRLVNHHAWKVSGLALACGEQRTERILLNGIQTRAFISLVYFSICMWKHPHEYQDLSPVGIQRANALEQYGVTS